MQGLKSVGFYITTEVTIHTAIAQEQRTFISADNTEGYESMTGDEQELKNKIVWYLARNQVTGAKNVTVDTVKNRASIPTHAQGDAEDAIRDLIRNPPPVQAYGGQRDAIQLTSLQDAVEYLEQHGGDVPFGLE